MNKADFVERHLDINEPKEYVLYIVFKIEYDFLHAFFAKQGPWLTSYVAYEECLALAYDFVNSPFNDDVNQTLEEALLNFLKSRPEYASFLKEE